MSMTYRAFLVVTVGILLCICDGKKAPLVLTSHVKECYQRIQQPPTSFDPTLFECFKSASDASSEDFYAAVETASLAKLHAFATRHSDTATSQQYLSLALAYSTKAFDRFYDVYKKKKNPTLTEMEKGGVFRAVEIYCEMSAVIHGGALREVGNSGVARFVKIFQNDWEAARHLSRAFEKFGDLFLASEVHRQFASYNPSHVKAHITNGLYYYKNQKMDQAATAWEKALELEPSNAQLWNDVGIAYIYQRNVDKALRALDKAIELRPNVASTYINLGIFLVSNANPAKGEEYLLKAVELAPHDADVYFNLGQAYEDLGKENLLLDMFQKTLELDPMHLPARGLLLLNTLRLCEWGELEANHAVIKKVLRETPVEKKVEVTSSFNPYNVLLYDLSPSDTLFVAEGNAQKRNVGEPILSVEDLNSRRAGKPINIAYVSSDFRNHAVGYQIMGVFKHHDRSKFMVWCLALDKRDPATSAVRKSIMEDCDEFHEIGGLPFRQVATFIAENRIDILIDLNGHTEGNSMELFSFRPSPIQINFLGFPSTSGASYFDYIVGDPTSTPIDRARHYSEHIIQMPNTYQINEHAVAYPEVPKLTETLYFGDQRYRDDARRNLDMPVNKFVFADFNSVKKIDPTVWRLWMNILKRTPNSVLLLLSKSEIARENLLKEAAHHGVDRQRILFGQRLAKEDHLLRCVSVDLYLDTLIYNSHTVASDVLFAGLPLVTTPGDRLPSRVASSMVASVGVPELSRDSLRDYEDFAVDLATKPAHLHELRTNLMENRLIEPLYDLERYVKDFEKGLEGAWSNFVNAKVDHVVVR